jgi:hypothetical protein
VEKTAAPTPPDAEPESVRFAARTVTSVQLPEFPGLYYVDAGKSEAIIGQAVLFRRTGSRLAGALTIGIVSGKINIKIPGTHATTHVGARPVFYYHTGPGDPPGVLELVLARLKDANGKRQLVLRYDNTFTYRCY